MKTTEIRSAYDRLAGAASMLDQQIAETKKTVRRIKHDMINIEHARVVIQKVAQQTQKQLEYHISELVSLALQSIFPEPYSMKLQFELKRGRSEAALLFEKDGSVVDPILSSGGGPIDVASFALRVCVLTIHRPNLRRTIVLDEPFRFVSRDLQEKAGDLLCELSKKLNLQFIVVTHEQKLIEKADRAFEVTIKKGISSVRRLDGHKQNVV